jgi:DNA-binding transcriptional ArsR family regulator
MKENWFRVHTSILDSRKFEKVSLAARGLWVTLCALAKERDAGGRLVRRDGSPLDMSRLAREVGYGEAEVSAALDELVEAGLVDVADDGAFCLHDWEEWQSREEERERWRQYKRRREGSASGCENVSDTENEAESGNPSDELLASIVQDAYAEAGLEPPNERSLAQGKKAFAVILNKSPSPSVEEAKRLAVHCLRTWRTFSWASFAEQFEREMARLRGELPVGKRKSASDVERAEPRYYRLIHPPPEWGLA